MAAKKTTQDLGIVFGVEVPASTRTSRYAPIYEALRANPDNWANITAALAVVNEGREKSPTAESATATLRKQGFQATTKNGEVFARFSTEEASTEEAK